MLGPDDLGRRVVVRRIVGMRADRPIRSDLLGELIGWSPGGLTVRTIAGPVTVPHAEIERAKPVPDRRRLSGTEALELAAAHGWPAAEAGRLGDWWLRASAGWTRRGNSALPIGTPDRPLDAAIEAVTGWYRARGLPPAIVLPLPLRAGLDAELARRGWAAESVSLVMTAPLEALDPPRRADEVHLDRSPSPAWLAVAASRKKALPDAALAVLTGPDDVVFPTVYGPEGAFLAGARGVVADPDRAWLGLSLIETAPQARRQGYAKHVIGALRDWALPLGARHAYLQVLQSNRPAIALYERLGFRVHHSYVARVLNA